MTSKPIVVFIARSRGSPGRSRETQGLWLRETLDSVIREHVAIHGTFGSEAPRKFVFVHRSNLPFSPAGDVNLFFKGLFNEARDSGRDVLLVIAGWDGLTTHEGSFLNLFGPDRHSEDSFKVELRVFAEGAEDESRPRRFFDIDIAQACLVFFGTKQAEEIVGSTTEFLEAEAI